jgi:acetyl esterase/lipase
MKRFSLLLPLLLILFSACIDDILPPQNSEIVYGDHPLQKFKLHLPANHNAQTKVVILVHGGGWVMGYNPNGEVTTFSGRYGWNLLSPLLEKGYACAVMKYRTACYNTVPEEFSNNTNFYLDRMMEDIDLVIDYLKMNATNLGIREDHFQVVGESAGGHIVMMYGIRSDADPDLKSVVPMFGPTDLDAQDFKEIINDVPLLVAEAPNYFLKRANNCTSVTNQQVRTLNSLKSFSDHAEIKITEPNTFLDTISTTSSFNIQRNTPLFITHGADDALVPQTQAEAMLDAMETAFGTSTCGENDFACPLKMKLYENCGHGWTGGNCQKQQVMNDIVEWLESH